MEERFVARNSLPRLVALLALTGAILIVASWPRELGLEPRPGWELMSWLAIIFFGAGAVVLGLRLFDRREQIVVDHNGILWRQWSDRPIPWSAISNCRIEKQYTRWPAYIRHLCIDLHDPAQHPRTSWRGRFFGRGWNLGFGDITVSTTGTDAKVDDLFAAMERFRSAEAL